MNSVQSTHRGQGTTQARDWNLLVKSTTFTEADVPDNGWNRTKTVYGAGSQRASVQPEVEFATSKPSTTISSGQSWLPPTN